MKKASANTVSFKTTDENAEIELEASAELAAPQPLTMDLPGGIAGEAGAEDLSTLPRVKLLQATSAEAGGAVPVGNFCMITPTGEIIDLGKTFSFVPLGGLVYYQADFNPTTGAKFPPRFRTLDEVLKYGGSIEINPPPGKEKFSLAMTLLLALPSPENLPLGILPAKINGKPYVSAVFYLSRTAYRRLGALLKNYSGRSGEKLWERTFGVESRSETQRGASNKYHVPVLRYFPDEVSKNSPKAVADFERLALSLAGFGSSNQPALSA